MTFSIIIPVFNVEPFLRECLDSILNQTFRDFEILAINDGSTDKSLEILREYEKNHSQIKVFNQENMGNGKARNVGLENASGKYIVFVDSDDFIDSTMLQFYFDIFKSKNCDIIYNTHKRVKTNSRFFLPKTIFLIFDLDRLLCFKMKNMKSLRTLYRINDLLDYTKQKTLTLMWGGVYKKAFLDENGIKVYENKSYEDIIFGMKIFSKNPLIALANEAFYNYRENLSSLSFQSQEESLESVALNIFKWINVSNEMEKIYIDSMFNPLGDAWEEYCKNALIFCINSAINELQKYGYIDSKYLTKEKMKESLMKLSKYVNIRKKLLIKYPLIVGGPKRTTRRIQKLLNNKKD